MKGKKLVYLKIAFILVLFSFTCLNFTFALTGCEEAPGGGFRCERDMLLNCLYGTCAEHEGCDYIEWLGNECWDGICYEWWKIVCRDGYWEITFCANVFLSPC